MKIKKRFSQHHAFLFRNVFKKQREVLNVQACITENEIELANGDFVDFVVECDSPIFFYSLGFAMAEKIISNWQ